MVARPSCAAEVHLLHTSLLQAWQHTLGLQDLGNDTRGCVSTCALPHAQQHSKNVCIADALNMVQDQVVPGLALTSHACGATAMFRRLSGSVNPLCAQTACWTSAVAVLRALTWWILASEEPFFTHYRYPTQQQQVMGKCHCRSEQQVGYSMHLEGAPEDRQAAPPSPHWYTHLLPFSSSPAQLVHVLTSRPLRSLPSFRGSSHLPCASQPL